MTELGLLTKFMLVSNVEITIPTFTYVPVITDNNTTDILTNVSAFAFDNGYEPLVADRNTEGVH